MFLEFQELITLIQAIEIFSKIKYKNPTPVQTEVRHKTLRSWFALKSYVVWDLVENSSKSSFFT